MIESPDQWVRSCCMLCFTGCGLDIAVKDGHIIGVRGLATDWRLDWQDAPGQTGFFYLPRLVGDTEELEKLRTESDRSVTDNTFLKAGTLSVATNSSCALLSSRNSITLSIGRGCRFR